MKILSKHFDPQISNYYVGDFNLPYINWDLNCPKPDGVHDAFFQCFSDLGLWQFVSEPTHSSAIGRANNILDLILCNDELGVLINQYSDPLSTSDHNIIDFSIILPHVDSTDHANNIKNHNQINLKIYDWSSADYPSLNAHLAQIDWSNLFSYHFTSDDLWNQFKSIIWPIIDIYVPTKFIPHNNKFKVKQYPKHIKKLLTRKAAIWRTFKTHKSQELKTKYTDIANRCKLEILKYDREKEERILKANNLGTFYKYVNKKISSKTGVAPLKDPQGNLIVSDLEIY